MAKVTIKRRDSYERADGRAALYLILYFQRVKLRIPVGVSVTSSQWDAEKETVRGRGPEVRDMNLIIQQTRARVNEILVRARLTGKTLTRETFLETYRRGEQQTGFLAFAEQHLLELTRAMQPETLRPHRAALRKLQAYSPDLQVGDITAEWLRVYGAYLRDHHGNNPGTIRKNMCVIRMHYYAAMRAGLVSSNPFEVYRLPAADPQVVFLTEEELGLLTDLFKAETLEGGEQAVLRFFLFITFTGMHISDARALQIDQVFGGEIHYRRIKTGTRVAVPMSVPARKLVDFYRDGRLRGPLLRRLPTDQAFNRVIKRICARLGIMKAVSAKAARHTFATLYYKKNSGDLGTLSKLLGHTSVNTTMVYAHIMKENRQAGISAFDDML